MKRFWVVLVLLMACVGLCACGGSQVDEQEPQVAAVILQGQNDAGEYTVEMHSEPAVQRFCELLEKSRGEEMPEPANYGDEFAFDTWDRDDFYKKSVKYCLLDEDGKLLDSWSEYYYIGYDYENMPHNLIRDEAGKWYVYDMDYWADMIGLFYRGEGQEDVLAAKVAEMVDAGALAGDFELIANVSEDAVGHVEPQLPQAVADKECCEYFWTMESPDGQYICYACPHHGSYMYDGESGESWLLFEGGGAPYVFEGTLWWAGPAKWYFLPNNDMVIVGWDTVGVYNIYGECVWPLTWDDLGECDMQDWKDAARVPFTHTERVSWQGIPHSNNYVYDVDFVKHEISEKRRIDIPNDTIIADFNDNYFVYIDDTDYQQSTRRIMRVDWKTLEQEVLVSARGCELNVYDLDEDGRVTFKCKPSVGSEFFEHEFWFYGEVK